MTLKAHNIDSDLIFTTSLQPVYALNEYLLPFIKEVDSNFRGTSSPVKFFPANSAPETSGHAFILYTVIPSSYAELYMIHNDRIKYRVTHTDFDTLYIIIQIFLNKLNVEDIQSQVSEPGCVIEYTHAVSTGSGNGFHDDQVEYWYVDIDTTFIYKIL